jgi:S-adenosylmethionine synthetase
MKTYAEDVSPGHPDRLADAIAEGIVTEALKRKPEALLGVEVAVHRNVVFIAGRIATGADPENKLRIVRDVYEAAGYGAQWVAGPADLRIADELCEEELPVLESDILPFSDDQNIVIGYTQKSHVTNYLSTAHRVAGKIGRPLFQTMRSQPPAGAGFGPDFEIPAALEENSGEVSWDRFVLSVRHAPVLDSEEQHRLLPPQRTRILEDLEARALRGVSTNFAPPVTGPQRSRRVFRRRPRGE